MGDFVVKKSGHKAPHGKKAGGLCIGLGAVGFLSGCFPVIGLPGLNFKTYTIVSPNGSPIQGIDANGERTDAEGHVRIGYYSPNETVTFSDVDGAENGSYLNLTKTIGTGDEETVSLQESP
jgi:hypothetical protein